MLCNIRKRREKRKEEKRNETPYAFVTPERCGKSIFLGVI